jgi:glycosyltransferase involved in cell wall biosynthesis
MGSDHPRSESRIKILVTASTYPRWADDAVPMFVHDQLVFLKKNYPEIDITLLTPHHPGAKRHEKCDFGEIFRFKYFFPVRFQSLAYPAILPNLKNNKLLYLQIPFLFLFEFTALFVLTIKRKPDYIYSHWFIPQGIVGGFVGMLTKTRHVYTSHSSDVMIANKLPILGPFLVRFFSRRAYKITVVSKRSYAKLKDYFSDKKWQQIEDKVRIIPMGVDTALFNEERDSRNSLKEILGYNERNILLFIGRVVEKKGIKYILEALKDYKNTDPSVLLVVAGDGPELEELKTTAGLLQVDNHVDFVGYAMGDRKINLFRICDVVLLPSIITDDGDAEGFPVVLMEALAAGKICIATDVSGADDIIENEISGFLIKQKSAKAILNCLIRIQELSRDEKAGITRNATRKAKMLDWNYIVKQHVDHLFG